MLTPREHEIMIQVAQGRLNKQVAGDIGIGEVTVKVHRSNLMRKMKAASLPELTRMADKLDLVGEKTRKPSMSERSHQLFCFGMRCRGAWHQCIIRQSAPRGQSE